MNYEFREGRLFVSRTDEEREPIVKRLRRIEGQVRGLIQMVEVDRYCLDEIQQAKAITSAMREAAMLILSSHLDAGVDCAIRSGEPEAVVTEVKSVIRAALKL